MRCSRLLLLAQLYLLLPWADLRTIQGAIKLPTGLSHAGYLSEFTPVTDAKTRPTADKIDGPSKTHDQVLASHSLEAPGSWYICAMAFFPEFRGQGLGGETVCYCSQPGTGQRI